MRLKTLTILALLSVTSTAAAEEPRLHGTAGAAEAVTTPQSREFGLGATGSFAFELPLASAVGLQASASALVLSRGEAPSDPTLAAHGTGTAYVGTVGVRVHPQRIAGLWIDANGGLADTGGLIRPEIDAHLGYEFRVLRSARWDAGPFVGVSQIVESSASIRPEDARVVSAGFSLSFGAPPDRAPAAPPVIEPPPPAPAPAPVVAAAEKADDECEPGTVPGEDGGCVAEARVTVVEDRIVLDDVVHFDFDSPRIRTASRYILRSVSKFLRAHPEIVHVRIEGHADARGSEEYNQVLSEARAQSARTLLIQYGADPAQLDAVGFGKTHLKVQTSAPEAKNRRVEFIVERRHTIAVGTAGSGKRGQQ